MSLDLEDYFGRIGWRGGRQPTYATLAGVLRRHMIAIPFENLDVLLGRPVKLDLDSIQGKLVHGRRGGYCFEHTTLFAAVLGALGFEASPHSARVLLFSPRQQSPRTHMFLTVTLPEGRFVVDPGFGGPAPLVPVPLIENAPETTGATHWMVRDGNYWILRTVRSGKPFDAWISTLEKDHPIDFEMANHFTATHPRSPFVNLIMMSRFTENGRVTVMNRDVTVAEGDGSESSQLADRHALRALIGERFGFDLPAIEGIKVPAIAEWP